MAKRAKAAPQKPRKPLTRAEFDHHLLAIGLMSQLPDTDADFDDPDDEPITIKGEPLSETVIRERRYCGLLRITANVLSEIRTDQRKGKGTHERGHEAGGETGAVRGLGGEHADQTFGQCGAITGINEPNSLSGHKTIQDEPRIGQVQFSGTSRPVVGVATGMQLREANWLEKFLGVELINETAQRHRIAVDQERMTPD